MRRPVRVASLLAALAWGLPLAAAPEPKGPLVLPPYWLDGLPSDEVFVVPDPVMLRELGELPPTAAETDLLTIGTRVKSRLRKDRDREVREIQVRTSEGTVTLSGVVSSDAQKGRALESAKEAAGSDVELESKVEVVPPEPEESAPEQDEENGKD